MTDQIIYYRDWRQAYNGTIEIKVHIYWTIKLRMSYALRDCIVQYWICLWYTTTETTLPTTYVMLDFIIICKSNLLKYMCQKLSSLVCQRYCRNKMMQFIDSTCRFYKCYAFNYFLNFKNIEVYERNLFWSNLMITTVVPVFQVDILQIIVHFSIELIHTFLSIKLQI